MWNDRYLSFNSNMEDTLLQIENNFNALALSQFWAKPSMCVYHFNSLQAVQVFPLLCSYMPFPPQQSDMQVVSSDYWSADPETVTIIAWRESLPVWNDRNLSFSTDMEDIGLQIENNLICLQYKFSSSYSYLIPTPKWEEGKKELICIWYELQTWSKGVQTSKTNKQKKPPRNCEHSIKLAYLWIEYITDC